MRRMNSMFQGHHGRIGAANVRPVAPPVASRVLAVVPRETGRWTMREGDPASPPARANLAPLGIHHRKKARAREGLCRRSGAGGSGCPGVRSTSAGMRSAAIRSISNLRGPAREGQVEDVLCRTPTRRAVLRPCRAVGDGGSPVGGGRGGVGVLARRSPGGRRPRLEPRQGGRWRPRRPRGAPRPRQGRTRAKRPGVAGAKLGSSFSHLPFSPSAMRTDKGSDEEPPRTRGRPGPRRIGHYRR